MGIVTRDRQVKCLVNQKGKVVKYGELFYHIPKGMKLHNGIVRDEFELVDYNPKAMIKKGESLVFVDSIGE